MSITVKNMENIAKLASIKLLPEETEYFASEINSIMHWIDQLQKVDVSGVKDGPTHSMPERQDVVTEHPRTLEVLENAPDAQSDWFGVPKIISQ